MSKDIALPWNRNLAARQPFARWGTMESHMNRSFLAGSILLAAALAPVAARADSPREFLSQALQGDNSEIMLGNLAADRARDPGVRDFGRTLVSDHSKARGEVLDVGRRFGIRPTREVAPEAREERDRLTGLRGRDFDREFVRYMIDDHRKDIGDFRDEAREHHGPVSDLAERQLPTLREHLRIAMSLDRDHGRFNGRYDQAHDWQNRDDDHDRPRDDRGGYNR
jgi:putative membrane protein